MTKIVEYRGYGKELWAVLEGNVLRSFLPGQPTEISDELFEEFQKKKYIAKDKLADVTDEKQRD